MFNQRLIIFLAFCMAFCNAKPISSGNSTGATALQSNNSSACQGLKFYFSPKLMWLYNSTQAHSYCVSTTPGYRLARLPEDLDYFRCLCYINQRTAGQKDSESLEGMFIPSRVFYTAGQKSTRVFNRNECNSESFDEHVQEELMVPIRNTRLFHPHHAFCVAEGNITDGFDEIVPLPAPPPPTTPMQTLKSRVLLSMGNRFQA